jgi:hypothetical protein
MSFLKVPVFGAQPYGFKATDVSGCRAWFDAADVSTLYTTTPITGISTGFSDYSSANGQHVTVWEDKSTGGNDMIRNVNASSFTDTSPQYIGPTIVAPDSYPTTLAVVNLDQGNVASGGGGDAGGTSNSPSFLQQNLVAVGGYQASGGPGSARGPRVGTGISATTDIFVVIKPKFLNVAGDVFSIGSQAGKSADFTCLTITSSGVWKINSQGGVRDVVGNTTEVFDTFSNLRGPDPNYRILHMSLSNNNYILRRNSTQIGSSTSYTWSPNLGNYRYYIGRKNSTDNAGNYFNGKIGEIIVYNQIITTEKRLIVESYLANKWNLIDLLPSDHPARLQNIPISLGGLSLSAAPNGFTRRGVMKKVFVLIPDSPTVNTLVIANSGTTLTTSWSVAGTGGTPDYYNVSIFNSTDNSTWSLAQYLFRYTSTSFTYTIGSIDDKYYYSQIEARNLGGGAVPVAASSILNSLPGNPTVATPSKVATNTLYLSWSPGGGGSAISYNIVLELNRSSIGYVTIYTATGITAKNVTVTGNDTSPIYTFGTTDAIRLKVTSINGSGSSSQVTSSVLLYPPEGA